MQEQEFERVGGSKPLRVDVRIVSTSNRHMKEAVEQKLFREDLYYRLNVVPLHLAPLRERKEDILPLACYFLERMCLENQKEIKNLSHDAHKELLEYPWPGNIRELANCIERAVVLHQGNTLRKEDLFLEKVRDKSGPCTLEELEKQHILDTLIRQNQNRTQAAKVLGITARTLRNKLHAYGIEAPE